MMKIRSEKLLRQGWFLLAALSLYINAQYAHNEQNKNEYARNPLTPGYGISDYFELMPDRVGNAKPKRPIQAGRGVNELSATILRGRVLKIRIVDSRSAGRFTIALHTLAGGRVWAKDGFAPGDGDRTLTFSLSRRLPGGIYFISIAGQGMERRTVRIAVMR